MEHLAEKVNKANRIVGLRRRTFVSLEGESFKNLYVALVRSHLEYANQVWSPYLDKDKEIVEGVQRRATKLVPTLKKMNYEQRLKKLGIPTLAYRRKRGEMIEMFKILSGKYDEDLSRGLFTMHVDRRTRGHNKKVFKERTNLNKRKQSYCHRVVDD